MEPAEEPVRVIRETTRNLIKLNRKVHKNEITDVQRSIETTRITPEMLADIANRLKSKSTISLAELHILKNSLIDDAKNIELVLSTHGSLRGLVREISGTDVKRQSAAAGCCCNLALGDSKACFTVAKAAGPYLVAALDNLNDELTATCAWALGNMAGSGPRAGGALAAQGALAALARLLSAPGDAAHAAVYALAHFTYQMRDSLSLDHLVKIIEAYPSIELTPASSQLLFILSCHDQLPSIFPDQLLQKILEAVTVSTQSHITALKDTDDCYELVHLLRTLANVIVNKEYSDLIMNYFVENKLYLDFKKILLSENNLVRDSLLWLLGDLYNYSDKNDFFNDLACC